MNSDQEYQQIKALVQIREIVGDPHGKLMQDELVERVRKIANEPERLRKVQRKLLKANVKIHAAQKTEIDRLREWIKKEGVITDTCTYDILNEICDGCRCHRMPKP